MGPVLCLVSDRQRLGPAGAGPAALDAALVACVRGAARAGVHLVQVRERGLEGGPLTRLVAQCVDAAAGTATRVIVNDRFDVAMAAGAHGVHLPGHGAPAARVRAVAPRGFLIGRSVHHASEASRVEAEGGLDYLVFGTVFPSTSKPGVAAAGIAGLAAAVAAVRLPVLAIGGVTPERAADVRDAGAAGIAAIGAFADACAHGVDRLNALVAQWARQW